MSNKPLRTDVGSSRAGVARLLTRTVEMTRKLECRLNPPDGWDEATAQLDVATDPIAFPRITGALLLRKARIHTDAALRANETSNLHSLAVQMRPVLECAGQVVFLFHNLMIAPRVQMAPERALEVLGNRLDGDHYQTLRARAKGKVSRRELLEVETRAQEAAAALVGAPKPKRRKGRRFDHIDKVATLEKGHEWYRYLSQHFGHGRADWRGLSSRGGVISNNRAEDEFAFFGLMDYLVNQVGVMNAHAALCPVAGAAEDRWERWIEPIEPTLAQLHDVRKTSRALRDAATGGATGEVDGRARTD